MSYHHYHHYNRGCGCLGCLWYPVVALAVVMLLGMLLGVCGK